MIGLGGGRDRAWILTFTGRRMPLLHPAAADYCIDDVAHGLAIETRWGSQAAAAYSVAQHSVLVVRLLEQMLPDPEPLLLLCGLLHDASEAVLKDIPRPLKALLPAYRTIERRHERAVAERFGLPPRMPPEVRVADGRAAATERRDLFPPGERRQRVAAEPHPERLVPWSWREAEQAFLAEYARLFSLNSGRRSASGPTPPVAVAAAGRG